MSNSHIQVPSLGALKKQAKMLRAEFTENGHSITHSKSLEILAHQHGFKDWNGLHAAAQSNSIFPALGVGKTVNGVYLGQKFIGEIIGLQKLASGRAYQLTLELDKPVDVVSFDSFSNLRRRIFCRVNESGISREKTSNGQPHMVLERIH